MEPTQTIEGANPAQISGGQRAEFGPQGFDSKTQSELDDLEKQIASASHTETKPETAPVPAAPPQTEAAGIPVPENVQVPEKFKTPDGRLDDEKLKKSLVNLEHYLKLERDMSQTQQAPQQTAPQTQPQWAPPVPAAPAFEARINEDLQRDPGNTVLNLMRAAVMQSQEISAKQNLDLRRRLELMEIAQNDPGIMTRQGAERLKNTLEENPWLWNSPTPWASAYRMSGPIAPRNGNEAAAPQRRSAPILPGGPAPAVTQGVSITSEADLRRHLDERFAKLPNGERQMKEADFLEKILLEASKQR